MKSASLETSDRLQRVDQLHPAMCKRAMVNQDHLLPGQGIMTRSLKLCVQC